MQIRRLMAGIIGVTVLVTLTACSYSYKFSKPDASFKVERPKPLPAQYVALGQSKTVKESDGATGTVTLEAVHYVDDQSAGSDQVLAVPVLKITATGKKSFATDESDVAFEYGTKKELRDGFFDDSNLRGPSPLVDYTSMRQFGQPMRVVSVAPEKSKTLIVALEMDTSSSYVLRFYDPTVTDDNVVLAGWVLKSAAKPEM